MSLSKTTQARIVSGAATAVNTAVAYSLFDSRGIAAYQAISGAAVTAGTKVPEEMEYGLTEKLVHGTSMIVGGTLSSLLLKGLGKALSKSEGEELDSDEINEVITEVTGLENPEQA